MKKITFGLMVFGMSLAMAPQTTHAAYMKATADATTSITKYSPQTEVLETRLAEIKAANTADMSKTEKRTMRKEVRSIRQQLSDIGGGVYLSVGAIILIVILLIILL